MGREAVQAGGGGLGALGSVSAADQGPSLGEQALLNTAARQATAVGAAGLKAARGEEAPGGSCRNWGQAVPGPRAEPGPPKPCMSPGSSTVLCACWPGVACHLWLRTQVLAGTHGGLGQGCFLDASWLSALVGPACPRGLPGVPCATAVGHPPGAKCPPGAGLCHPIGHGRKKHQFSQLLGSFHD